MIDARLVDAVLLGDHFPELDEKTVSEKSALEILNLKQSFSKKIIRDKKKKIQETQGAINGAPAPRQLEFNFPLVCTFVSPSLAIFSPLY